MVRGAENRYKGKQKGVGEGGEGKRDGGDGKRKGREGRRGGVQ